MKVIGKSKEGNYPDFIVEASERELANIMGFNYESSKECPSIKIGSEINVSAIFNYLEKVADADLEIRKAGERLKDIARLAEGIIPMFPPKQKTEGKENG